MKLNQKTKWTIAVAVALLTLFVYLPSLRNDFVGVWDDNINIVENPHIRSIDATFFQWAFFDFHGSNWIPLTWISLAVDYSLWGLNPLGYHLTNIVLHAMNTLVVVLLIVTMLQAAKKRTLERNRLEFLSEQMILLIAALTGLLYGLHPVHVESVVWAAERKDLLCALFFLLSIISYISYVTAGSAETGEKKPFGRFFDKRYLLTLCLFSLALLSKPMAVTLPVVLLILDWYPFNRLHSLKTIWSAFFEKFPFVIMSLASSIITLMAQSSGASVASLEFVPLLSRVLVAANSIIAYLGKMLLPLDLIPFYPYPKSASLLSIQYLSALVLVIVITAASAAVAKRHRVWLSVWGYYVVTLMPVLGLVQVGNQAMADRYAYLPSIGPFLAAGSVIAWLVNEVNKRHSGGIMAKFPYMVTVVCLIVPLSYLTFKQIGIWENGYVLWNHTIQRGFESATAYNNRGLSLDEMGQQDKALADFGRAITLDPRNYFAYNNTGVIYGKEGQYQRSIEYFLKAIAINPGHADSYCNLGLSYFNVKRYDKAMENYNAAIRLKQNFDMAYLNRGNLYLTAGDKRHAMADYQKSCTLGNKNACELANLVSRE